MYYINTQANIEMYISNFFHNTSTAVLILFGAWQAPGWFCIQWKKTSFEYIRGN